MMNIHILLHGRVRLLFIFWLLIVPTFSYASEDAKILPFVMPDFLGSTKDHAVGLLSGTGQYIAFTGEIYSTQSKGTVAAQIPAPGYRFTRPKEMIIQFKLSKGLEPGYVIVPNVIGMSARKAEAVLTGAGLTPVQTNTPPQYFSSHYINECEWGRTYVDVTNSVPAVGVVVKKDSKVAIEVKGRFYGPAADCQLNDGGIIK